MWKKTHGEKHDKDIFYYVLDLCGMFLSWHMATWIGTRQTMKHVAKKQFPVGIVIAPWLRPCLDTPAGLELELISNSSSSPKLTLTLEVFGW
jgi:hypothetical protein